MTWTGRSSGGGEARALAALASVLFHGAVLLLLARHLSQVAPIPEAPPIQVTLIPRPQPLAANRERRRAEPPRREAMTPLPPRASRPTPVLPSTPFASPPSPSVDTAPAADAQRVLRNLSGCDPGRWDRLSFDARARCEARAQRGVADGGRLELDPSGRYAADEQPFLSRKPKNGCRARAAGDVDGYGDSGHVRAGVGCAFSF